MIILERTISENINWLIQEGRVTERELAKIAGTSQSSINKLKNGKSRLTSLEILFRIGQNFGFSIDELINTPLKKKRSIKYAGEQDWAKCKVFVLLETPFGPRPSFIELSELENLGESQKNRTEILEKGEE